MYEVMRYWEDDLPDWDAQDRDFASMWRSQLKWVASRSLKSVGPNATLIGDDFEAVIRRLKAELDGEIDVAGPNLAGSLAITPRAHESRIRVQGAGLYCREVGRGAPMIVLHGGPDFDISYLLPEKDRLSDRFHLIYYDQRGRGRSADYVKPEDVTLESEMADLDEVREHFHLDKVTLLGHSWGTVLALEYALRQSPWPRVAARSTGRQSLYRVLWVSEENRLLGGNFDRGSRLFREGR